ncbi:hypothetical protein [Algicola sagamiensis]|uniref:hypothetical protein n=1 Tax=Algicola sagamiensis TaxID=163869 RepID=UPI000369E63E|nr:hypothetical protein [Algicola sagamiensis]
MSGHVFQFLSDAVWSNLVIYALIIAVSCFFMGITVNEQNQEKAMVEKVEYYFFAVAGLIVFVALQLV